MGSTGLVDMVVTAINGCQFQASTSFLNGTVETQFDIQHMLVEIMHACPLYEPSTKYLNKCLSYAR